MSVSLHDSQGVYQHTLFLQDPAIQLIPRHFRHYPISHYLHDAWLGLAWLELRKPLARTTH